jgi:hypothetical protein
MEDSTKNRAHDHKDSEKSLIFIKPDLSTDRASGDVSVASNSNSLQEEANLLSEVSGIKAVELEDCRVVLNGDVWRVLHDGWAQRIGGENKWNSLMDALIAVELWRNNR